MLPGRAIRSWTRGRRTSVLVAQITAILSAPLILCAYSGDPQAGSPLPTTMALSTSSLTFTSSGAAPPAQQVLVVSTGAPIAVITSLSTNSGGLWLTATPSGGNTPLVVTVRANPAGLTVGTYTGTIFVLSPSATNGPLTVSVTFTLTAAPAPASPALVLSASSLTFSAAVGGTAASKTVQVTSSGGSPLAFAAAVSTASGANWLSASPASGATPAAETISVDLTGLAAGTDQGTVTFTSSGASNSPLALGVTLTVSSQAPTAITVPVRFKFNVIDLQSGGPDSLLLDGKGSVSSGGEVTGSGHFVRYSAVSNDDDHRAIIATGTWKAASATSFTPASGASDDNGHTSGGVLVLQVVLSSQGGSSSTASMSIASTGSDSGVTLTIDGGATFVPSGTGRVRITAGPNGNSDDQGDDGEGDN